MLNTIIENYDDLLVAFPDKTSDLVPHTSEDFDFSKQIRPTGKKEKKFYEHVVDAMGYNDIRNKIYPVYAKKWE